MSRICFFARSLCFASLALWSLVVAPQALRAGDPLLERGVTQLVAEVAKALDEEKLPRQLIVGDFVGLPKLKASGGVEVRRLIEAALKSAGIEVVEDGDVAQILGRFNRVAEKEHPDDDFESLALEITATLLDSNGGELRILPLNIFGNSALSIAGIDADVKPTGDTKARQLELQKQIANPGTTIDGSLTRPSAESPFAVEILIVSGNSTKPRKPTLDSAGRSYIELNEGEEYVVRLHNSADFEAAVTLAIDGVNTFADAQDTSPNSRFIVKPRSEDGSPGTADIPGWYITKNKTKAFLIGGYEGSVAQRLGQSLRVGTVTAMFHASWEKGATPPPDDFPSGGEKGVKATHAGRELQKDYVSVTRDIGALRATVNVRYNKD